MSWQDLYMTRTLAITLLVIRSAEMHVCGHQKHARKYSWRFYSYELQAVKYLHYQQFNE